jgi:hypothetical protein
MSVGAIDGLFAIASNPLSLLNMELAAKAKIALLLAILIW